MIIFESIYVVHNSFFEILIHRMNREAKKDINSQLIINCERLGLAKSLILKDSNNLLDTLKEVDDSFEKLKQNVQENFNQLKEIFNYKEKELILQIDFIKAKRKSSVEKDLENMKNNMKSIDSLTKIINFGLGLNSSNIIDGNYLIRINHFWTL